MIKRGRRGSVMKTYMNPRHPCPFVSAVLLGAAFAWLAFQPSTFAQTSSPAALADQAPKNPALIHWQAIAMLPDLSADQNKIVSETLTGKRHSDDEAVTGILRLAAPSLSRWQRAAAMTEPCEWGITREEGPFAPLPHLAKLQILTRLAMVQADIAFRASKIQEAVNWMMLARRSAYQLGSSEGLLEVLAEYGLETQWCDLAARHVLRLDKAGRLFWLERMQTLPARHALALCVRREQATSDWLQRMVLGIEAQPELEKEALAGIEAALREKAAGNDAEEAKDAAKTMASIDEWKGIVAEIRQLYARIEAAATKPWGEAAGDWQSIRSDIQKSHPLVKSRFPAFEQCRRKELELQTKQTVLEAVLKAEMSQLPPKEGSWETVKDSFYERAVIVRRESGAGGIVIGTAEKINGREIALRFLP